MNKFVLLLVGTLLILPGVSYADVMQKPQDRRHELDSVMSLIKNSVNDVNQQFYDKEGESGQATYVSFDKCSMKKSRIYKSKKSTRSVLATEESVFSLSDMGNVRDTDPKDVEVGWLGQDNHVIITLICKGSKKCVKYKDKVTSSFTSGKPIKHEVSSTTDSIELIGRKPEAPGALLTLFKHAVQLCQPAGVEPPSAIPDVKPAPGIVMPPSFLPSQLNFAPLRPAPVPFGPRMAPAGLMPPSGGSAMKRSPGVMLPLFFLPAPRNFAPFRPAPVPFGPRQVPVKPSLPSFKIVNGVL